MKGIQTFDIADELRKASDLFKEGILSESEFMKIKEKILNR